MFLGKFRDVPGISTSLPFPYFPFPALDSFRSCSIFSPSAFLTFPFPIFSLYLLPLPYLFPPFPTFSSNFFRSLPSLPFISYLSLLYLPFPTLSSNLFPFPTFLPSISYTYPLSTCPSFQYFVPTFLPFPTLPFLPTPSLPYLRSLPCLLFSLLSFHTILFPSFTQPFPSFTLSFVSSFSFPASFLREYYQNNLRKSPKLQ